MTIAYLNGQFLPLQEAKISPLDRGFLFGDGVYDVTPCHDGVLLALDWHMERLEQGLQAIQLAKAIDIAQIRQIYHKIIARNAGKSQVVYLQITRGADTSRGHLFPQGVSPTVFVYSYPFEFPRCVQRQNSKQYTVVSDSDLRWQRCHIKSVSLLGNLLHLENAKQHGVDEVLLFNRDMQLTEAGTSNVFIVQGDCIATPPLDTQILPGVTRRLVIAALKKEGIEVQERIIDKEEVFKADEVWLSSSSKNIAPITRIDDCSVGDGQVGKMWEMAIRAFHRHKASF